MKTISLIVVGALFASTEVQAHKLVAGEAHPDPRHQKPTDVHHARHKHVQNDVA